MPSVVHIDTARTWRGGQLQVFLLHRELVRLGVASRLLVRAGGALHHRCEEVGLPVEPIGVMRSWYPPSVLSVVRRTRSAAIVHAHDSHAVTLAAVARKANPHLSLICHRRIAYPPSAALVNRWKYHQVSRWIAVSQDIAGKLDRAGAANVRVVASAVDVESLSSRSSDTVATRLRSELGFDVDSTVVGLVGALARQKGHQTLIDAASKILEVAPKAVFLCIGEGRLRARLQRRTRQLGVGGVFRFTGFRWDVPNLMSLCRAVVVPSLDGEGSSAVIKEAMVLGVPVVASDLPGNQEVLNGFGMEFPVGDVDALANAVVTMLQDPERGSDDPKRVWDQPGSWFPKAMAGEVLSVYESLGHGLALATEAV